MIFVCDVETTGIDARVDAVVEIALVPVVQFRSGWRVVAGAAASTLVAPGRRIPPGARAVHHLTDEELCSAPHLSKAVPDTLQKMVDGLGIPERLNPIVCIAAHNAEFDRGFLGPYIERLLPGTPWLCTWRCARHLYPEAESYGNQVLRYTIPGVDAAVRRALPAGLAPHRALYDTITTAYILKGMLSQHPLEYLLQLQHKPVLLVTCRLPKHRNQPWSAVPPDYLRWVLRADPPFDQDTVHTASHYLNGGARP